MPDYRLFFDANSMSAVHLQGQSHILTISKWVKGKLGRGDKAQRKPIVYFKERELPLAINKTNGAILAQLYGKDIDQWVGKKIEIYPTTTQFGAEIKDCIRIKPHVPKGKASEVEVPERDEPAKVEPDQAETLTAKIAAEMEANRGK